MNNTLAVEFVNVMVVITWSPLQNGVPISHGSHTFFSQRIPIGQSLASLCAGGGVSH